MTREHTARLIADAGPLPNPNGMPSYGPGTPVLDANGSEVSVPDDVRVTAGLRAFMAGRVPAGCGHYIAKSEADAGFATCERC